MSVPVPVPVPVPAAADGGVPDAAPVEAEQEVPSYVAGQRLEVGWPVIRGPDWDYGDQDGGNQEGEVYFVKGGWCIVKWKNDQEEKTEEDDDYEDLAKNLYAYPWQSPRAIAVVGDPTTRPPLPGGPAAIENLLNNIAKRAQMRTKVRVDIQRVGSLNTVAQSFRCGMIMHHEREMNPVELKWWLTYISHKDYSPDALLSVTAQEYLRDKQPRLQIKNTLELHNEDRREMQRMPQVRVTDYPGQDEPSQAPNCFKIKTSKWYDRTIFSELDLRNFPLDCNELVLEFKAMQPKHINSLEPHSDVHAFVHLSTQQSLGNCEIERVMVEVFDRKQQTGSSFKDRFTRANKKALKEYSCIAVRLKIARTWSIYLWRIIFFLAIIGLMGVTVTYMLSAYKVSDLRVEVQGNIVTLLLAAVAFQVTFESDLPETQYMTFLDQYVNWSFFYLALISIEVSFADVLEQHIDNYPSRTTWSVIFLSIYFFGQAFFAVRGYRVRKLERLKLYADSTEVEENLAQKPFDVKLKKGEWDPKKYRKHKWLAQDTDQFVDTLLDNTEDRVKFMPEIRPKKNPALKAALNRRKSDVIDTTSAIKPSETTASTTQMEQLKKKSVV